MPIYEYECQKCRRIHEVIQRMHDPPLAKCPECGSEKLEKLISAAAIIVRESTVRSSQSFSESGGLSVDAVPDDFRHPKLGVAVSRLPGR